MENEIVRLALGLQILAVNGYRDVIAVDGVIYAGDSVDEEYIEVLDKLGWEFDEDKSQWYILVQRQKTADSGGLIDGEAGDLQF